MVKSSHDSNYIERLAEYVDVKMKDIAENTSIVSTNKIAVLAALNIADELFQNNEKKLKKNKLAKESISNLINKIDIKLGQ
ncbi:cell division protein ZapA [Candidatus Poribacteria bacterium]|nr:cell division protein ZapA [Candidatus Poribacteria bacterium]